MKKIVLLLSLTFSFQILQAQDLPRRAFFGIQMEPVTDDVQRVMNLPAVEGVLVQRVIPSSTAEAAGLRQGDVLLELDGKKVNSPNEAVRLVSAYRAGHTLNYKLIRAGKMLAEKTTIQGLPRETYPDLETTYGSVQAGDALLRTIVTRSKKSKPGAPALLFVQGIGCYSLDTPTDTARAETQLLNHLARQGFTVMRVDKSGIGDSRGEPCGEIDFYTELEGYRQAFAALQKTPGVDAQNCFIFGHSMGGLMAPLVAKELPVKGIIAYGTLGVNFMEYFHNTRRTIAQAYRMTPAETDDYIKEQSECAALLLAADLSREEAVKRNAACGELYDVLLLRSKAWWEQLYDLNIPFLWQNFAGKTLAVWGSADYISAKEEHEHIANVVNEFHPGNGTFLEIKGANHGMNVSANFQEALNNPGSFNPEVAKAVADWLKKQAAEKWEVKPWGKQESVSQVMWMEGVENAYPRWSADGNKILFQSNRTGSWHLFTMNANGSDVRQITQGNHNNNFPDWSPDNSKVAFTSDRHGNEEIYLMNLDGSGLTRLTNHAGRDIHPYFSPDGKSLLFNSSRDNAESFEVYQTDLDGKNQKRLTQTADVETCARFSPDGKKIVCLRGFADGNDDIFTMNPDGSNPVNLTNTPQREGWPAWSPDGSKIIFSSMRNGNFCLYEMNANGSGLRQLTFAEPPRYDARAGYAANGKVLFNRQAGGTIGIFVLERGNG